MCAGRGFVCWCLLAVLFLCTAVKFGIFHFLLLLSSPWRAPVSTAGGLTSPPGYEPGHGASSSPPRDSSTCPQGCPLQVQVPGCVTWSSSQPSICQPRRVCHSPRDQRLASHPCKAGASSLTRGPDPQLVEAGTVSPSKRPSWSGSGCCCPALSSQTCSSPGPVGAAPLSLPPTLFLTSPF